MKLLALSGSLRAASINSALLRAAAKLAPPAGTMERYRLQEWLSFINSELHKSFTPLFSSEATEDMKTYSRNYLAKRLAPCQETPDALP